MGTTLAVLRSRVRRLIPEATEIEWPNERLNDIINLEYRKHAAALGMLPGPGWFTTEGDITITANTTTFDLTGVIDATAGDFAAIKTVFYLPPDGGEAVEVDSVAPGHEERARLGPTGTPVGQVPPLGRWLSRPAGVPTLNVGPQSNVDRDFRVYLRYTPVLLEDDADEVETDPLDDDVIVRAAALRALEEVSEDDPAIRDRAEKDVQKSLARERNSAGEFTSETTKVVVSEAYFGGG
jgi:hypothetical protein